MKKFLFFFFINSSLFAIGSYKTGDIVYNWKNAFVNIRLDPNIESQVVTTIAFGEKLTVVDKTCKTHPFSVKELPGEKAFDAYQEAFKGYTINGYWVQIELKSGEKGNVFDGYLSKLIPNFELTEDYFDNHFKLLKSSIKKNPDAIADGTHSKSKIYKNNYYFIENGSNYDGHIHFFVPNLSVEEGYLLLLKTNPELMNLGKNAGDEKTSIGNDKNSLSFWSSLESQSVVVTSYKGVKGIEIILEGWD